MQYLIEAQKLIASFVFLDEDEKSDLMKLVLETKFKDLAECIKFIHARANIMRMGEDDIIDEDNDYAE